jgi:hypothetical protein
VKPNPSSTSALSLATGDNQIYVYKPCVLPDPGWKVYRVAETLPGTSTDRYARLTCVNTDGEFPFCTFLPLTVDDEVRVHIFFAANYVFGDAGNDVTCHAVRAAADIPGWITFILTGQPESKPSIAASQVLDELASHGYPRRVDRLRLSAHSRGGLALRNSLTSGDLVAAKPKGDVLPTSILERVVSFDAAIDQSVITSNAGIKSDKTVAYHRTAATPFSFGAQMVDLGAGNEVDKAMTAISYGRVVLDGQVLGRVTVPPDVDVDLQSLGLLPLGSYASRGGLAAFYAKNTDAVNRLVGSEYAANPRPCQLSKLIDDNDLVGFGKMGSVVWKHHLFVADLLHEVTDD